MRQVVLFGGLKPSLELALASSGAFPAGVTYTGASLSTFVDATGKITFKPNNLLLLSNTFSNAAWTKDGTSVASGVSDPNGGTSAFTLTSVSGNKQIYAPVTVSSVADNYINAFWVRRRTGTGTVGIKTTDGLTVTDITSNLSTSWQRLGGARGNPNAGGPNVYTGIVFGTAGDEVDIFQASISRVTYETSIAQRPAGDQTITTASAYYGPRFGYDPVTLGALGYLSEEQRTNLILQSQATIGSTAPWSNNQSGAGAVTITANAAVAPDGTTSATKVVFNRALTTELAQVYQQVTGTVATYAESVYLKADGAGDIGKQINFRITDGTSQVGIAAVTLTAAWQRIPLVGTLAAVSSNSFAVGYHPSVGTTQTGAVSVNIWGGQAELTSTNYPGPTSYIPTAASTVTRAADVASEPTAPWYNQAQGTFVIVGTPPGDYNQFGYVASVNSGGSANQYSMMKANSSNSGAGKRLGVQIQGLGALNGPLDYDGSTFRFGFAYAASSGAVAVNSAIVNTTSSLTLNTPTLLEIGQSNSDHWFNGHIASIKYYPRRLTDARLQQVTA